MRLQTPITPLQTSHSCLANMQSPSTRTRHLFKVNNAGHPTALWTSKPHTETTPRRQQNQNQLDIVLYLKT